jgi:hypothetical protein
MANNHTGAIADAFFGTTTASAQTAINKKVTFGADGIALKDAFQQLEKLSGLSISYNNSTLDDKRTVRLKKPSVRYRKLWSCFYGVQTSLSANRAIMAS